TFVEDQVNHRRHRRDALCALRRSRRIERHLRSGDSTLRPRDPLLERALGDEEGARDLLHREPADDAQRQRDLLCRGELWMAADEEEPENIVLVLGIIEARREARLEIALTRQRLVREL